MQERADRTWDGGGVEVGEELSFEGGSRPVRCTSCQRRAARTGSSKAELRARRWQDTSRARWSGVGGGWSWVAGGVGGFGPVATAAA